MKNKIYTTKIKLNIEGVYKASENIESFRKLIYD